MTKECTSCVHWVMCIWKKNVDLLINLTSVRYAKTTAFRKWRDSFAELCEYHTLESKAKEGGT